MNHNFPCIYKTYTTNKLSRHSQLHTKCPVHHTLVPFLLLLLLMNGVNLKRFLLVLLLPGMVSKNTKSMERGFVDTILPFFDSERSNHSLR